MEEKWRGRKITVNLGSTRGLWARFRSNRNPPARHNWVGDDLEAQLSQTIFHARDQ